MHCSLQPSLNKVLCSNRSARMKVAQMTSEYSSRQTAYDVVPLITGGVIIGLQITVTKRPIEALIKTALILVITF
jgi:hypothetical protein